MQRPGDHYIRLVSDSIGLYADNRMQPNTGELAERLFLHSRSINRYFHRVIGLSPKKFLSIVRTRAALTRYLDSPEDFSPSEFGYYDKSHFYKAIPPFTGRSLSALH
jgi:methylphosphotriester-DNA--protein-cysteine methyltransferase